MRNNTHLPPSPPSPKNSKNSIFFKLCLLCIPDYRQHEKTGKKLICRKYLALQSAENTGPYHLPKYWAVPYAENTEPYQLPKFVSLLIRKRSYKFTQVDFPPTGCPIIGSNKLPFQRQTTMDKVIRSPSCEV